MVTASLNQKTCLPFFTAFAGEVFDVTKGLGLGLGEILAAAFVLDDELAAPEEINGVDVA